MNVRQFGLKNSESKKDQMFDLMDIHHFFNVPDGLGWGMTSTVERVGETFIVTDSVVKQQSPKGKMWFSSYEEYETFLRFIQIGGLVLCYKPSESIPWRYLECSADIKKSEIDHETNYLTCEITFTGLSRWYEAAEVTASRKEEIPEFTKHFIIGFASPSQGGISITPSDDITPINPGEETQGGTGGSDTGNDDDEESELLEDEESPYDYLCYSYYEREEPDPFGDYYYYQYMTEADGSLLIENGAQASYFRLSILGPCSDPSYYLLKDGKVLHSGKINVSIPSGRRLVIDTNPKTVDIALYSSNSETRISSLYAYSDFTTDRIFSIPPGDSVLYALDGGNSAAESYVEVKKIV